MAYETWQEPALLLSAALEAPDDALVDLSNRLGIQFSADEPRLFVIAKVEDEVSRGTSVRPPRTRTTRQAALLAELGVAATPEMTVRAADALIRTSIVEERLRALRSLRPTRGDRLIRTADRFRDRVGEIVEVSSIDRLGQVWVRGAGGYPTYPQDLAQA